jgi:hypothetical protein
MPRSLFACGRGYLGVGWHRFGSTAAETPISSPDHIEGRAFHDMHPAAENIDA